ncbi:MAG: GGDEF domain-containing protein [Nitrospirota bacterium]
MTPDHQEAFNNLLIRLKEEIIPLFQHGIASGKVPFVNSYLVRCQEVLKCKSDECAHYNAGSSAERCWHIMAPCCNDNRHGGFIEKSRECLTCKVFKNSCPTIVEEIGEHINNMTILLNEQEVQMAKDAKYIADLQEEMNTILEQLRIKEKVIQEIMITDKLTTLFNRQHLVTVLEDEIARCQRYDRPIALMMIDIDGFRAFNAAYGHQAGDNMLAFIGTLIRESTRKFDRAFRYGGEEFVVVLPESDMTMAYIVAERIRKGFENNSFLVKEKESDTREDVSRTISIGITATFAFGTENIIIEDLINQAEKALYLAKGKGGNICIRYE